MSTLVQPKLPRVDFYPNKPGEPYRPCNGTEGEFFHSMWCEECAKDAVQNGSVKEFGPDFDPEKHYCEILNRSFRSDEPLPEWVYGDDGQPKCTQFVKYVEPREGALNSLAVHDDMTVDMFGGAA